MRPWLRNLLIALSLANLCFLNGWTVLLTYTRTDAYFIKALPPPQAYVAVLLNVLCLGGVLWLAITLGQRYLAGRMLVLAEVMFFLFLLIPLNAFRDILGYYLPLLKGELFRKFGETEVGVILAFGAVVLGLICLRWPAKLRQAASGVLLIMARFIPILFLQGIVKAATRSRRLLTPNPSLILYKAQRRPYGCFRSVWTRWT